MKKHICPICKFEFTGSLDSYFSKRKLCEDCRRTSRQMIYVVAAIILSAVVLIVISTLSNSRN